VHSACKPRPPRIGFAPVPWSSNPWYWEIREVIDAGAGRFGVRLEFLGTGRGSGIETRQQQWHVVVVERGIVLVHSVWATEAEALAALGSTA
jgi:hypothetical protein